MFAVAGTSKYLRFFSTAGVQRHIISLKGPLVTMAAQDDLLSVFYHAGAPTPYACRFTLFRLGFECITLVDDCVALTYVGYDVFFLALFSI